MICVCGVIVVMIDNEMTKIRYFADTYFPFLPKSVLCKNGRVLQSFLGLPFPYVIPPFLSLLRLILPFRKTVMSFRARARNIFLARFDRDASLPLSMTTKYHSEPKLGRLSVRNPRLFIGWDSSFHFVLFRMTYKMPIWWENLRSAFAAFRITGIWNDKFSRYDCTPFKNTKPGLYVYVE